jgi:Tol biopolymer transport system component
VNLSIAPKVHAPKMQKTAWLFLAMALIPLSLIGCGGSMVANPVVSQSQTVAFASNGALDGSNATTVNSNFNIWAAKADGSGATPLTRLTQAASLLPAWSPDGMKLAFISSRALDGSDALNTNSIANIWVMNADGTAPAPVTRLTAGVSVWNISWSPDGKKLVFSSSRALDGSDAANTNSTENIWVVNADGSGAAPLTRLTVNTSGIGVATSQTPTWSSDSRKVAFLSAGALDGSDALNTNQTFNIWAANVDGSATTPLTRLTSGAFQSYPAWSPDGTKVAFIGQRTLDGSDAQDPTFALNLWVVKADGSSATPLTRLVKQTSAFYPIWSPDGARLAYGSDRALDGSDSSTNSLENTWVINADGSGARALSQLTAGMNDVELPTAWSHDGTKVAIGSSRALDGSNATNASGQTNVWVLNTDGSGSMPVTRLTSTSASSALPQWQP